MSASKETDLELAVLAVEKARAAGATAADAVIVDDISRSVRVRDGEIEKVQRSHSRGLGVRALHGGRTGTAFTNDVTPEGVATAAAQAATLAVLAAEDACAGLPDAEALGMLEGDLDQFDDAIVALDPDALRDQALACETAAREDARITRSGGTRAGAGRSRMTLANSHGFAQTRGGTSVFLSASVFATGEQGERQRDSWSSMECHLSDLETAQAVGRKAAERAIRRCGWKRPESGAVPVVFSPEIARDFARTLASGLSAESVYRGTTFMAQSLGETLGSSALTLVDDATLPRRMGSRAFDGEGLMSRRTVLIDEGRVASWLADTYAGKRADFRSTGNASRSVSGSVSVGSSNLILQPGTRTPQELLADIPSGLYVTDLFGFGVNLVAGTWSRGGSGIWIENGELTHPVQEFTVAGELRDMMAGFAEAANDLEWLGSSAAPTVRIDGLTVAAG